MEIESPCELCLNGVCEDCCQNCTVRYPEEWIKIEVELERRILR